MLKVAWTQADLPDALTRDGDRGSQDPLSDELMHDRVEDSIADVHDVCDWSLGYSMVMKGVTKIDAHVTGVGFPSSAVPGHNSAF
jgi:hypothetical protein